MTTDHPPTPILDENALREARVFPDRCLTCRLGWWLNPPVKIYGSNSYRCIECKDTFTAEALDAALTQGGGND